jgi:hypothetical protein
MKTLTKVMIPMAAKAPRNAGFNLTKEGKDEPNTFKPTINIMPAPVMVASRRIVGVVFERKAARIASTPANAMIKFLIKLLNDGFPPRTGNRFTNIRRLHKRRRRPCWGWT